KGHPLKGLGEIEATNPCGELPLLPYESCNLASINLSHMVEEKDAKTTINWEKLGETTEKAIRFLDNVIEVNDFPLPQFEEITKKNRKVGLGVMGFAEMLIRLGVPYDSEEAIGLAERVMSFVHGEATKASIRLAEERGVFPNWEKSKYHGEGIRMRNTTVTSIAPTGTISIIAGTTSSIEPIFAVAYRRTHVLEGQSLFEINPVFLEYSRKRGFYSDELIEELLEKGTLKNIKKIPEDARRIFVTALEIPYEQHIRIQAAFQKHVDNSVSKTINMPEEATVEDVKRAYILAYELGCKGITIFRYGSRREQVLELGVEEEVFEKEHFSKCDPQACKL
ncbi:MAG TPA: adenosylcobalamin-dependent ribonucleoside-diphosphate reductase, partial [Thermodesulfobacteriota bacterium]|nr:adenosylcobalamin-dependent ribonucleoside-diphosphate reductase [Thermodesulfobacteriota bacterium]